MVNFAGNNLLPTKLSVLLQQPYDPLEGEIGYGYSARRTGPFYIALWLGMLCGQTYGIALTDRIPLGLGRRAKAKNLMFFPVGLGHIGAFVEKH
ncbi:MAG: hypothetical protein Q9162_006913 [Coniocarpon cinnabarinum]